MHILLINYTGLFECYENDFFGSALQTLSILFLYLFLLSLHVDFERCEGRRGCHPSSQVARKSQHRRGLGLWREEANHHQDGRTHQLPPTTNVHG